MTPLLAATLSYAAGLLIGFRTPLDPVVLAALACAPLLLACVRSRRLVMPLALAAAGAVCGSLRAHAARDDCRERLTDRTIVHARGVATALPAEGVTFTARLETLETTDGTCTGVVIRVRVREAQHAAVAAAARAGQGIELRGRWLTYAPRNGWPRSPQFAGMLLVDAVEMDRTLRADGFARVRVAQQARLRALLPQRWGAAEAMLLAQKGGLTPETRARWVAAGLVHLLAISGMHVGLIAGGVIGACALLGVSRRRGRAVALVVTAAYVAFLGAPSAALRALLQASLLLGSLQLQRPAEPFTVLAAAALGLLLLEPLALLDPGFQLSFAGMIGLIAWRRPLADAFPERMHPWLRDGLAAGIAASALTTPIAALHFGTASWIGIPATIVAAPVLALAIGLTAGALAWSALTGAAAGLHALPADLALRLLDGIAAAAAAVPGGHGHLGTPTVLYGLLVAAAALLVRAQLRGEARTRDGRVARTGRLVRLGVAGAALVAAISWAPLLRPRDAIELHVIDVGQGDAIAIRSPAGRWLLVDAGPRTPRFDAGRDRVVPYLLRRGARRIDALVLTHPDADHIGGAEAVLDVFDVGLVIDPGLPAGKDMFIDLLASARRSRVRWVAGRAGISFTLDGVVVEFLYPHAGSAARDANDNSVVFRLTFGTFGALFTGDAPASVEDAIVARAGGAVRSDVLKVGHHGSRTSTGDSLLRAARPELALISAGRNNRYGHPHPTVVRRLEAHGVRVVRTDDLGSFIVRASRTGAVDVLARRRAR